MEESCLEDDVSDPEYIIDDAKIIAFLCIFVTIGRLLTTMSTAAVLRSLTSLASIIMHKDLQAGALDDLLAS